MTIIDDSTPFTTMFLLEDKSDPADAMRQYISAVETQIGRKVQMIHSDNWAEYVNPSLCKLFEHKEINDVTSVPYSDQSNKVVER